MNWAFDSLIGVESMVASAMSAIPASASSSSVAETALAAAAGAAAAAETGVRSEMDEVSADDALVPDTIVGRPLHRH